MENLYSRQIGALGSRTMKNISKLRVLIYGLDTIGTEAAKSLSLMGVKELNLVDDKKYNKEHYGRLLLKSKKGVPLATVCKKFIENLQTSTNVKVIYFKNAIDLIKNKQVDAVVLTKHINLKKKESLCLTNKIPFIFGYNSDFLGYAFVNFGNWKIIDSDGETLFKDYIYNKLTDGGNIKLYFKTNEIPISKKFSIQSNSSKYSGKVLEYRITSKNNEKILEVIIKYNTKLEKILKCANPLFSEEKENITLSHVKFSDHIQKKDYKYVDLRNSFDLDDTLYTNYTNFLLSNKNKFYTSAFLEKKNTKFYILGSLIGGILAHEVIKTTHKYAPLSQDILFNCREFAGKEFYKGPIKFSDMGILFDKNIIKKIKNLKMFMIGCGALGCEISKNLGMLGFCQSKKSSLSITDMDTIELSNLTRQFLFQKNDIGKDKSKVMAKKLQLYCPEMKTVSYKDCVGEDNEKKFNYSFWDNKEIIINALDNVKARQYVDSKCVLFKKPLFESGTLGVKGNVQVIIPKKTATYSEIVDPPEKNIPMCTIRNFPNNINHCIEWSLGIFDKLFNTGIRDCHLLKNNKEDLKQTFNKLDNEHELLERISILYYLSNLFLKKNILALTELMCFVYKQYYTDIIKELLKTHPDDSLNDDGDLFWSGNKIKPKLIKTSEILKKSTYLAMCNILNVEIDITDFPINTELTIIDRSFISEIILDKVSIPPKEYDKDDPLHLDCLKHFSNIRAECYNIPVADELQIKLISGKIIPALSTTTSIISSFVVLDILKYILGIDNYSETNINIGLNTFTRYKAFKPKITHDCMFHKDYGMKIKTRPCHFSTWDKISINGHINSVNTSEELVEYLKDLLELDTIEMITSNSFVVYSETQNKLNLKKLYKHYNKLKQYSVSYKEPLSLEVMSFDTDGTPILIPDIIYTLM